MRSRILILLLALTSCDLFAAEDDVVWVTVAAESDNCEIEAQRMPCASISAYLKVQLQIPSTFAIYVNFYKRSDREVAVSTAKSIREAGYEEVEVTSIGFAGEERPMSRDLTDLGTRYAAAWSSQNPERFASFYAEEGSLIVNGGQPATGRAAIAAKAQSFMTAFPDMVVKLERMDQHGDHPVFRWIWTGTNTGPGGTGKFVRMTGYEEWTLDANGLIAKSDGHYDEAEYERQLKVGAPPQP